MKNESTDLQYLNYNEPTGFSFFNEPDVSERIGRPYKSIVFENVWQTEDDVDLENEFAANQSVSLGNVIENYRKAFNSIKDFYPFYEEDYYVEVPDELAALMQGYERQEKAYAEKTRYHKAYYSLERDEGGEKSIRYISMSPEEIYERKLTREELYVHGADLQGYAASGERRILCLEQSPINRPQCRVHIGLRK